MNYGYYDNDTEFFDIRDMDDSDEFVCSLLEEQLNSAEEQIDSIMREIEHISRTLGYIRERFDERFGGK